MCGQRNALCNQKLLQQLYTNFAEQFAFNKQPKIYLFVNCRAEYETGSRDAQKEY